MVDFYCFLQYNTLNVFIRGIFMTLENTIVVNVSGKKISLSLGRCEKKSKKANTHRLLRKSFLILSLSAFSFGFVYGPTYLQEFQKIPYYEPQKIHVLGYFKVNCPQPEGFSTKQCWPSIK